MRWIWNRIRGDCVNKWDIRGKKRLVVGLVFFLLFGPLAIQAVDDIKADKISVRKGINMAFADHAVELYHPYLWFESEERVEKTMAEKLLIYISDSIPFQHLGQGRKEDNSKIEVVDFKKVQEEQYRKEDAVDLEQKALEEAVLAENRKKDVSINVEHQEGEAQVQAVEDIQETVAANGFVPVQQKQAVYLPAQMQNVEFIKKNFYTVDATTMIKNEQLSYDTLIGYDAVLKQGAQAPQILIYHTHSQEGYIDSDPQDAATTIMGVGEYLCAILRAEYGFHVIHHMGMYDVESRDDAYAKAAVGLEEVLAKNPSIEVIIDLHRDAVNGDRKLVTNIQGMEMAQFMFFNGLSYTRARGELTSLPNPYIQENLAFAFQMKLAADEYYPGLTRKTYLKGYRYNLQYRPKSLLIELGAQTNTVEEAMNACRPLAHIISMVLKGENKHGQ